ncbi:MAG TPA: hypothetical protein VET85_10005, partial [Stellaceae bacterium]|nr:hypothetical protein [Stellaceae bacterium]
MTRSRCFRRFALIAFLAAGSSEIPARPIAAAADTSIKPPATRVAADAPHLPQAPTVIVPPHRGADGKIDPDVPNATDDPRGSALDGGRWTAVPNSHMDDVTYDGPLADAIEGNSGPPSIIAAWGGATLDTRNHALLVWGGGHADYWGNEVYAFDLKTLRWTRLNDPAPIAGWNGTSSDILPDGTPSARHTYDSLTFLPASGQMFEAGSAASLQTGSGTTKSWLFNPTTRAWRQAADYTGAFYGVVSAYDPADQCVYAMSFGTMAAHPGLQRYDPRANAWTAIGGLGISDYHMTAAIDPADHILVAVGAGHLNVVNLGTGAVASPPGSGDLTVQNGNAPGFVWDPSIDEFVDRGVPHESGRIAVLHREVSR